MSIYDITFKTETTITPSSNVSKFNVNKGSSTNTPTQKYDYFISLSSQLLSSKTANPVGSVDIPRATYNRASLISGKDINNIVPAQPIQPNQAFFAQGVIPQPDPNEQVVVINAKTVTVVDNKLVYSILPCFTTTRTQESDRILELVNFLEAFHFSDFGPIADLPAKDNRDLIFIRDFAEANVMGTIFDINGIPEQFENNPCDMFKGTCCVTYGVYNEQGVAATMFSSCYLSEQHDCQIDDNFMDSQNFQWADCQFFSFEPKDPDISTNTNLDCSKCNNYYYIVCDETGNLAVVSGADVSETDVAISKFDTIDQANSILENIEDSNIYVIETINDNCLCVEKNYWCYTATQEKNNEPVGDIFSTLAECQEVCSSTTTTTVAPTTTSTTTVGPSTTLPPDGGSGQNFNSSSYVYNHTTKGWEKRT